MMLPFQGSGDSQTDKQMGTAHTYNWPLQQGAYEKKIPSTTYRLACNQQNYPV